MSQGWFNFVVSCSVGLGLAIHPRLKCVAQLLSRVGVTLRRSLTVAGRTKTNKLLATHRASYRSVHHAQLARDTLPRWCKSTARQLTLNCVRRHGLHVAPVASEFLHAGATHIARRNPSTEL